MLLFASVVVCKLVPLHTQHSTRALLFDVESKVDYHPEEVQRQADENLMKTCFFVFCLFLF